MFQNIQSYGKVQLVTIVNLWISDPSLMDGRNAIVSCLKLTTTQMKLIMQS